jgi:hypothetical protein
MPVFGAHDLLVLTGLGECGQHGRDDSGRDGGALLTVRNPSNAARKAWWKAAPTRRRAADAVSLAALIRPARRSASRWACTACTG